jgi:hypothetical protein
MISGTNKAWHQFLQAELAKVEDLTVMRHAVGCAMLFPVDPLMGGPSHFLLDALVTSC